ncbi:hypothetical protein [Roseibium algae]|uniref:MFS transporter n=1 Tax=Roseibium algae TaxID=3123038 RepID=A0ABU8TJD4_9HYPH
MASTAAQITDTTRKTAMATVFWVAKNVLFWGSMALSGYVLYALASFALE